MASSAATTTGPAVSSPLDLVVRFSTTDPDVLLHVADTAHTTGLTLKVLIRDKLDHPANDGRLRLIHAGKVILDNESLSRSLGNPAPPLSSKYDGQAKSEKAKGKLPVREAKPVARVYIHCSIGDALSSAQLDDEKTSAAEADAALSHDDNDKTNTGFKGGDTGGIRQDNATLRSTTSAPQGFDRLLSTGFTTAEVATLRSQFRAIQAHTHTPDTMPTGQALLALEEQWLEQPSNTAGPGNGAGALGDDGIDDMLWGTIMGFFWPVGLTCCLMREQGLWSRRRQMTIMMGFSINLMFGLMRLLT